MKVGKSIIELATELQRRAGAKSDYVASAQSLTMTESGSDLIIAGASAGASGYALSSHAHNQIGAWAGVPAKYYDRMKAEAPHLLAENINHWFGAATGVRRMIRTLDGNARAFLSDRYRRIDNEEIAEAVLPVLFDGGDSIRIESCEVTESRLYLKAVFPRIQGEVVRGDVVQSGIVISNSEVGLGSLSVQPLVYRLVCSNGMIAADAGMARYHVGRKVGDGRDVEALLRDETKMADDRALMMALADVVRASLSDMRFEATLAKMRLATDGPQIIRPVQAVEALGKAFTVNQRESQSILENLIRGSDYSRWGLLNAVTQVANTHDDYDRATQLEQMGGLLLDLPSNDWNVIAEAA